MNSFGIDLGINESGLFHTEMYHGSDIKLSVLKPTAYNAGHRLKKHTWSVFMWPTYELAYDWAVFKAVNNIIRPYHRKGELHRARGNHKSIGFNKHKFIPYLLYNEVDRVKDLCRGKKTYVYTINCPINTKFGIGNNNMQPEYTYDGELKIKKTTTITITDEVIDQVFDYVDMKEYDERAKWINHQNIRGPIGLIFYPNEELMSKWAYSCLKIETGESNYGDDPDEMMKDYSEEDLKRLKQKVRGIKEENTMLEASTDTRLLISQDDIYINFNDWKTKKSNVLFVIGLSGSGKSTLSNKMAEKYHAYRTETDTIAFKIAGKIRAVDRGHGTWEWIENADPMVAKYLRAKHLDPMFLSDPRFDVSKTKPTRDKESEEIIQQEVDKYIYWLCYEQKERVVIEGGHGAVCITRHEEMYRKMPIIIKGTSIAKSMLRRTIRDADEPRDLILRPFILLKQYSKMVPEMNRVRAIVLKDNDIEYIKEDIDMEKIYVDSEKGFISEEEYMNDQNIVINEDATDFELSEEEQKEMDLIEREVHKWAEDARKTGR